MGGATLATLAVTGFLVWRGDASAEALQRAFAHLHRALAGDGAAFEAARRAFRDAVGGPFSDRLPHFGVHVATELERIAGGAPPSDAALAALARRDFRLAARLYRHRGGAAAEHGARLARALHRLEAPQQGDP